MELRENVRSVPSPASTEPLARRRDRRWLFGALGAAAAGFTASKLGTPTQAKAADGDAIIIGEERHAQSLTRLVMDEGADQQGLIVEYDGVPGGPFALGGTAVIGKGIGVLGAGVYGYGASTGVRGDGTFTGVDGTSGVGGFGVHGLTVFAGGAVFPACGGRFETYVSDSIGAHALVSRAFGGEVPANSIALLVEAPDGNLAARFVGNVVFARNLSVAGDAAIDGEVAFARNLNVGGGVVVDGEATFVNKLNIGGDVAVDGDVAFAGGLNVGGSLVAGGPITAMLTPASGGPPIQSFAMQSLQSWIEDFGEQPLTGQSTRVTLSPAFAAVADVSSYHVFLSGIGGETPQVTAKDATGFTVSPANQGSKQAKSFSYRIVARPR